MKKIHYYLLLLTLGIHSLGYSANETEGFKIFAISYGDYSIPLVSNPNRPMVVQRINQTIQMSIIENLYKENPSSYFNPLLNRAGDRIVGVRYTVLLNTPALLSLQIHKHLQTRDSQRIAYLNFNAATGEIIDVRELFTPQGFSVLDFEATQEFSISIEQFYYDMLSQMKNSELEESDKSILEDMLFSMIYCNTQHRISKYSITPNNLFLAKTSCMPDTRSFFNDINWGYNVAIDKLDTNYLTSAGRQLLIERKPLLDPSYTKDAKVMTIHGKINHKYAFSMILDLTSHKVLGKYWYDKNGGLIEFEGKKIHPNRIEVIEEGGKFLFEIHTDGKITGDWIKSNGQIYPIAFD
ncbi:hypothetical protein K5X82_03250 [Halosquirtibacter xylanolyticus]|uniref:hypothetical protein n=1 Tax=Halosquirtibacter xylanolyticus TaxID=3374599 RepID=UPI0037488CDD|nr:hypothetical protein K5X82_03250 [Prolixibacteraceae bacterium]